MAGCCLDSEGLTQRPQEVRLPISAMLYSDALLGGAIQVRWIRRTSAPNRRGPASWCFVFCWGWWCSLFPSFRAFFLGFYHVLRCLTY